jgi:hypothetical protein
MRSALLALAALGVAQDPLPHDAGYSIQSDGSNRYEAMYGKPEFYSLELLVGRLPGERNAPTNQSIRTVGILYVIEKPGAPPSCTLCKDEWSCLSLDNPAQEIRDAFFHQAAFRRGDEAEVVGAFANPEGDRPLPPRSAPVSTKGAPAASGPGVAVPTAGGFFFWSFHSGPPREKTADTRWVSLESLVRRPDRYQKRTIAVRGLFRGRNLFGDLPADSQKSQSDWVLRDGAFFIWVTGKAPKGRGFALDLERKSDAAYRLEVEGQTEVRSGLVYLRAREVRLLGHANDSAH